MSKYLYAPERDDDLPLFRGAKETVKPGDECDLGDVYAAHVISVLPGKWDNEMKCHAPSLLPVSEKKAKKVDRKAGSPESNR